MTTTKKKTQLGTNAVAVPLPRLIREESFHTQPVAVQNNVLYNKPREALVTIPQLMDNPLYEGFMEEGNLRSRNSITINSTQQQPRRTPLSRLSLDESHVATKPSRRLQSLSLSSRDYEGMCRTFQENVCRNNPRSSVSALEDFKQFRQRLAELKQFKEGVGPDPPTVLTPSGSFRSFTLGSPVSTRSLTLSPSRPTSPLKRLSVIASRKGVSGLNPQRNLHWRGAGLPPTTVQRFALGFRAEGLFKLPKPASISPVSPDQCSAPQLGDSGKTRSSTKPSKRRFFKGSRAADYSHEKISAVHVSDARSMGSSLKVPKSLRGLGGQTRAGAAARNDESIMSSCSPRLSALNSPRRHGNAPQQKPQQTSKKQTEKITSSPSCSPRGKDIKTRCLHMPRPMCYSAHILD